MSDVIRRERQIFAELAEAKLLRAVYGERQLEEVLVDFWFNHFNVFARKGRTEIYIGEYERDAIRPHVLGRFRDLLEATAKSPAMLFYLDNWLSADPNASQRCRATGTSRPRPGARRRSTGRRSAPQNRPMRGLNENYARELLELHTLGVDGGYTQQDVVEVARAFTGWTIGRPGRSRASASRRPCTIAAPRRCSARRFQPAAASRTASASSTSSRGIRRRRSTSRWKLAQRFVSDDAAAGAGRSRCRDVHEDRRRPARGGARHRDVAGVLRARELSREGEDAVRVRRQRAPRDRRGSSGRHAVVRALAGLGMPLYLCQPPTGYDETAATWVSSGALVNRLNFAVAMAGGELRGVRLAAARRACRCARSDRS